MSFPPARGDPGACPEAPAASNDGFERVPTAALNGATRKQRKVSATLARRAKSTATTALVVQFVLMAWTPLCTETDHTLELWLCVASRTIATGTAAPVTAGQRVHNEPNLRSRAIIRIAYARYT